MTRQILFHINWVQIQKSENRNIQRKIIKMKYCSIGKLIVSLIIISMFLSSCLDNTFVLNETPETTNIDAFFVKDRSFWKNTLKKEYLQDPINLSPAFDYIVECEEELEIQAEKNHNDDIYFNSDIYNDSYIYFAQDESIFIDIYTLHALGDYITLKVPISEL